MPFVRSSRRPPQAIANRDVLWWATYGRSMPGRHDQPPHRLCQASNRTSPSGYDDVAVLPATSLTRVERPIVCKPSVSYTNQAPTFIAEAALPMPARPSSRCCKPKPDLPKALHVAGLRPMTPPCVRPSSRVFLQGPRHPHDANALGYIAHMHSSCHSVALTPRMTLA